jgi:hypothetical protein
MGVEPAAEPLAWPRRIAPALLLLVLAPLTAEFLLGDFTVRYLGLMLVLLPQYGGGALLIREVTRRAGRGWPTMILLAVAYALVEEGFTTQSLFNRHYLNLSLLDYGYVPFLGTSLNWSVFVLSIHVVWSICTPILIAEAVAGPRRTTPWLGRVGLAVVAVLFALGSVLITGSTYGSNHFVATVPEFAGTALLTVATVAAAFLLFRPPGVDRPRAPDPRPAPPPWLVLAAALVLASAFQLVEHLAPDAGVPAPVTLLALLACEAAAIALVAWWSRRADWTPVHVVALGAAAILTYAWVGLFAFLVRGHTNVGGRVDAVDVAGQVVLAAAVLGLVAWGWVQSRRQVAAGRPAPAAA